MIADVEETKRRWQYASQIVKAESLAAVADSRAAFSDALIKLEKMIEERLDGLRQLIDQKKKGPRVRAYVEDKVHYEGQLVTHEGSTYQALCDTGRGLRMRSTGFASRLEALMVNRFACEARIKRASHIPDLTWLRSMVGALSRAATIPAHVRVTAGRRSVSKGERDQLDQKVIGANAALPARRSRDASLSPSGTC
jgi:hypothetical protein